MRFAIVLGYAGWGYVRRSVQYVKSAGLTPFLVGNVGCDDYTDILPEDLILKSEAVNDSHRELLDEIESRLGEYAAGEKWSVDFVSNYADRMWLCYIDLCDHFKSALCLRPESVIRCANKANLRFITRGTPWEVPYVLVPSTFADKPLRFPPLKALAAKSSALIVKPVFGIAGEAVSKVLSNDFDGGLRAAIERVIQQQRSLYSDGVRGGFLGDGASKASANGFALVEEYLEGSEYSIEGFSSARSDPVGLVIQQKTSQEQTPVFRDLEYVVSHNRSSMITKCVRSILRKIGFKGAPFHMELKSEGGWAKPIEFNPRMGGGSIIELVNVVHGIDLQGQALTHQLAAHTKGRVLLTTVIQPRSGKQFRVLEYRGLDEVERQPDVVFVKRIVPVGGIVTATDREVYLVEFCVVGATVEGTKARAEWLKGRVEVLAEEIIRA